jgi:hemerythrin-like domain-containing protein
MHATLQILRSEHTALVALLRTALAVLAQSRASATLPDFTILRAMLFYIAEFPERHHHRKESEQLFPRVRARSPLAGAALDRLEDDHLRGEARIRELEHGLTAFEMLGEPRREPFELALRQYVDFYLKHMMVEEREIFPLAQRVLHAGDWQELDAEITPQHDPLTGGRPEACYVGLFDQITRGIPAPLGLG